MVRVKENPSWFVDDQIDIGVWQTHIASRGCFDDLTLIKHASTLAELAGKEHATEVGQSCLHQGLLMADVLLDLEIDQETIAAAILFETVHYAELSLDDVGEQVSPKVAKLIKGVEQMSALSHVSAFGKFPQHRHQIDNVRKMLLAMVDDVRVVMIKLAERLCVLRSASLLSESMQKHIATEAMEIYAPLANRLGVGAIKWEMEDLAFRYLYPEDYKSIAKGLKAKRLERDSYVTNIVEELNQLIHDLDIHHFSVYGRSKHIHSIYKKMKRKNVSLDAIYDATAVRVLVDTESQCYDVLSLVHAKYKQVISEFDDYIAHPKSNGYQSLHTAVTGPNDRVFEVQIRTFKMHDLAEMGVAAHWKYKEGGLSSRESHERKIDWLRNVLAWHKEMATNKGVSLAVEKEFLEDRVYVFTPEGDVLDLPHGVTPLDFAYHVHSRLGHRCRGAKVNGSIVPLTYALKTGDRVEILTGKEEKPSRDWINPHLNYLKTSRAKAKVLHWFKMQDFDRNRDDGLIILDKELRALGLKNEKLADAAELMNFHTVDDMLAGLGRGDIKVGQIISKISPVSIQPARIITKPISRPELKNDDLHIEGVGNLLTHMARCCQPLPGDDVLGYITLGRGVSIHRQDCPNILHADEKQKNRFLEVNWGSGVKSHYLVDIKVQGYDRHGLLRDVSSLLTAEKANVHSLHTQTNRSDHTVLMMMTLEIDGISSLSRLLLKLEQIPNVIEARRQI